TSTTLTSTSEEVFYKPITSRSRASTTNVVEKITWSRLLDSGAPIARSGHTLVRFQIPTTSSKNIEVAANINSTTAPPCSSTETTSINYRNVHEDHLHQDVVLFLVGGYPSRDISTSGDRRDGLGDEDRHAIYVRKFVSTSQEERVVVQGDDKTEDEQQRLEEKWTPLLVRALPDVVWWPRMHARVNLRQSTTMWISGGMSSEGYYDNSLVKFDVLEALRDSRPDWLLDRRKVKDGDTTSASMKVASRTSSEDQHEVLLFEEKMPSSSTSKGTRGDFSQQRPGLKESEEDKTYIPQQHDSSMNTATTTSTSLTDTFLEHVGTVQKFAEALTTVLGRSIQAQLRSALEQILAPDFDQPPHSQPAQHATFQKNYASRSAPRIPPSFPPSILSDRFGDVVEEDFKRGGGPRSSSPSSSSSVNARGESAHQPRNTEPLTSAKYRANLQGTTLQTQREAPSCWFLVAAGAFAWRLFQKSPILKLASSS
ncbi:unnamed protein product, partial [Amoebophrya sp. A25]